MNTKHVLNLPSRKTTLLSHTHDIIINFSCRKIKPGLPAFLAPGEGKKKKGWGRLWGLVAGFGFLLFFKL